jgi:hypothetical protein
MFSREADKHGYDDLCTIAILLSCFKIEPADSAKYSCSDEFIDLDMLTMYAFYLTSEQKAAVLETAKRLLRAGGFKKRYSLSVIESWIDRSRDEIIDMFLRKLKLDFFDVFICPETEQA